MKTQKFATSSDETENSETLEIPTSQIKQFYLTLEVLKKFPSFPRF